MDNFVRVDCDFCAWGLWDRKGAALEPEALGLSPALCVALQAWQAHFDELMGTVELPKPRFNFAAHEKIGRQIAELVRAERPDLHVVFQGDEPYPGDRTDG